MGVLKTNRDTPFITSCVLLIWAVFSWLYIGLEFNFNSDVCVGYFPLLGETGLDIFAIMLIFRLRKKITHAQRKRIFLYFFLAFISAAMADFFYNVYLNIFHYQNLNSGVISLFDVPFLFFLSFQLIAWASISFSNKKKLINTKKSVYIPYIAVSVLMFCMFMFGISWKIGYSSLLGVFQILDTMLEVIGFYLATISLARAKTMLLRYISVGYLLIVSSDFVIRYDVVSGLVPYLSPFEATWMLGIALTCIGFLLVPTNLNKDWFELLPVNSLQSQMAIWLMALWLLSVFVFSGIYYLLVPGQAHNLIIVNLLSLLVPLSTIANVGSSYIAVKLSSPFTRLQNIINDFLKSNNEKNIETKLKSKNDIFEFVSLENFVFDAFSVYNKENSLKIEFSKMAAQISHDIKSPLAALDMAILNFSSIPENDRILIRSATSRIKDIANNLLKKNREAMNGQIDSPNKSINSLNESKSIQLLLGFLDGIVSEKRLQLRDKPNIQINFDVTLKAYGIFAEIQPIEFGRVISNLLNNAIEIFEKNNGQIKIELEQVDSNIEIRIIDNGRGIAPEVLNELGKRGVTQGKLDGNGLGIYHARSTCEANAGELKIESEVGKGTTVVISIPKSKSPTWFLSNLKLMSGSTIFILDDDASVKEVWRQRFEECDVKDNNINVYYFSTSTEFEEKYHAFDKSENLYCLLDYEIIGDTQTGLDLANKLNIGTKSILITSRWYEESIQNRCIELGMYLIPKNLVSIVPIQIRKSLLKFDAVLLDDDHLISTVWETIAKINNKKFLSFSDVDIFLEALNDIDKDSSIYIDSQLKNNIRGQDLVPKVKALGFDKIYLATGYDPNGFPNIEGLSAIVGKYPPVDIGGQGE